MDGILSFLDQDLVQKAITEIIEDYKNGTEAEPGKKFYVLCQNNLRLPYKAIVYKAAELNKTPLGDEFKSYKNDRIYFAKEFGFQIVSKQNCEYLAFRHSPYLRFRKELLPKELLEIDNPKVAYEYDGNKQITIYGEAAYGHRTDLNFNNLSKDSKEGYYNTILKKEHRSSENGCEQVFITFKGFDMKNNRDYWAVGSSFDGGDRDVTEEFIQNSEWYDGYAMIHDYRDEHNYKKIKIGDVLVMKSSATKGPGHSISFTKAKGLGIVINKRTDYHFDVKWIHQDIFTKDFDGISYRKTIENLRDDDLLMFAKKTVRPFTIEVMKSKYSKFLHQKVPLSAQSYFSASSTVNRIAIENKIVVEAIFEIQNLGDYQLFITALQKYEEYKQANKTQKDKLKHAMDKFKDLLESQDTSNKVIEVFKNVYEESEEIKLLKYKKQIILQGPPGTGKTYLAKQMAKSFTGNSEEFETDLDSFFREDEGPTEEDLEWRKELKETLADFYSSFPAEKLHEMSLTDYAFGDGTKDNFCYWIEYGLRDFGSYPGAAQKFKIYWSKQDQDYRKSGFIKDIDDNKEAMSTLANVIQGVVNEKQIEEAIGKLSNSFILKLLNSYHPDKYFPINSEVCLENALLLFNVDFEHMNFIERSLEVQRQFELKRKEYNTDITNVELMYYLFDNYDMKGTLHLKRTKPKKKKRYEVVQFHPSYSYEDFVRGIEITSTDHGLEYNSVNKILVQMAIDASEDPDHDYLLIIDEINRANLPSVLGELIYALEYRDEPVKGMYEVKINSIAETSREITLPSNLYIIGTMNTADRSVGHIDYAIRRRFAFVDCPPQVEIIQYQKGFDASLGVALFYQVADLFNEGNLNSDFKKEDVQIGHSYFMIPDDQNLKGKSEREILEMRLEYEIKPILREYVKDGVLNESVLKAINDLKV
ncbi:AAA domain-containing protein [bacterium]|nr:AAA domain-containing protein [bacterium]